MFAAALLASGGGAADAKTGQSPACERFCMSVKPAEACIEIAYIVRLRTGDRGGRADRSRFVSRSPRYRVLQSGSVTEPSSAIAQRGLWAISQGWPSGSTKAAE